MAAHPVTGMAGAAVVCAAILSVVAGLSGLPAVLFGMAGPAIVAIGSWIVVERVHQRAPDQVSGVMIKLFGAKILLFGAYAAAAVLLVPAGRTVFVVSFVSHYILLHFIEALYLRRLFSVRSVDGQRLGVS